MLFRSENTGLDIRQQVNRFKPAVLSMNPSMNAVRGYEFLRNENDNKLYYFLQVDEDDFVKLQDKNGDASNAKLTRPSEDPGDDPISLRLSSNYSGFKFVHDPVDATTALKKDGSDAATALSMIMNAASTEISENGPHPDEKAPDAEVTEHSSNINVGDESNNSQVNSNVRTVGEQDKHHKKNTGKPVIEPASGVGFHDEAKLNLKSPSLDAADDMAAVSCCCHPFW